MSIYILSSSTSPPSHKPNQTKPQSQTNTQIQSKIMKTTTTLLPFLAATPAAQANIHVGFSARYGNAACPSPGFGCGCISSGIGRACVNPQYENLWKGPSVNWFSTNSICNSPKLDFWRQPDGHWNIYVSGQVGQKKGECWKADTTASCLGGEVEWFNWFWCYTEYCG
ncbi:hypothetical protein QBC38DRAFT_136259 [Podospora fimiseda]|uniref:Uncharacterized protein n=1 Tax=Podospora fimiseda TaxID=252190 RepID=A0AAN7BSV8_9PEZI|nr:hypothetical protein QBC38DRAFT_136259 [Podospora fimiseda]